MHCRQVQLYQVLLSLYHCFLFYDFYILQMNFTRHTVLLNKVFKDAIKIRSRYHIWTGIVHASVTKLSTLSQGSMTTKREKKADAKKVKVVQYSTYLMRKSSNSGSASSRMGCRNASILLVFSMEPSIKSLEN